LGSTRPSRNGKAVADRVFEKAQARLGADCDLIDLLDHHLPAIDEAPEYNHSTSGVLKNSIDYLYAEWNNKAAAFVGYGSVGGARAVEHLRAVCSELQIAHVRQQLAFSLFTDFENFSDFRPAALHDDLATTMFDQLEAWAGALKPLRK
jgi:NAD(P)H-dependent FMN reductase